MNTRLLVAATLCTLLLSGCSHRLFDFTMISSKNVPIGTNLEFAQADQRVTGSDSKGMIFSFPLGIPDVKEAVDEAIERYPGAVALSNGVVYAKGWSCIFYGKNKYVVEGNPVYIKKTSTTEQQPKQSASVDTSHYAVQLIHEVQRGETITKIAEEYKVSVRDIIEWNKLISNVLNPGLRLVIYIR